MANKIRIMAFVFLMLIFTGTNAAADTVVKAVKMTIDGEYTSTNTTLTTVGEYLEKEGIILGEKDEINISSDAKLNDLMPNIIKIQRGFTVNVVIDKDDSFEVAVGPSDKAGHVIKEIERQNNTVYLFNGFMNDSLKAGDTIYLSTTDTKDFTTTIKIPFESETRYTLEIDEGAQQTLQKGEYGEVTTVTQVNYVAGEEDSRSVKSMETTKEPVKEIVLIGDVRNLLKTPHGEFIYEYALTMEATAYSPEQISLSDYTATGDLAVYGVVAVDPTVISLGTILYVEGYGQAIACDTGKDIKGNRIDLCYNSVEECWSFGRRDIKVYVLK